MHLVKICPISDAAMHAGNARKGEALYEARTYHAWHEYEHEGVTYFLSKCTLTAQNEADRMSRGSVGFK